MLGGERALCVAEHVVVITVAANDQHDGYGQHPGEEQTCAMAPLGIVSSQNRTAYTC